MKCSACGAENPAEQKFCNECAAPFKKRCAKCGYENAPTAKFCGECAAALVSAAIIREPAQPVRVLAERFEVSAIEGERKTVTALFADIKGSTELMEELDPEEARAIIDPALKIMVEAVRRYEGYVVQSTGDGIFALFGAPVAHEDHPQRALYAALRLQDELERYSARLREAGNLPIEGRVGVNTGEVVVRSITTGAGQTEYTPIGHTTNLASRMQALAPTGSIAISEGLRKLIEGYFLLKPLGPARIKGVSEPVNVYEVIGLGPLRTRLQRAAGRGLTKFVGREREMEALKQAAEQAKGGHGQIVAAMAEPGVGKSRLLFEYKAVSQSGWMVLEALSVSYGKASAYLPVVDLLRNYLDITTTDDERRRREKVAGKITILDRSLEDTLPYLFSLLGIVEGVDPLAQMDRQIKKRRTLEAIKRILLRESLDQPLMVIFEDLHWIDEETQALLNLLADSIGTAKVLLLVNYRPEYSHQWGSKTYYTQLRLDALGAESAREMLDTLLGASATELSPLKRLIIEKTEGNPFFMEETVQVLLDEGALVRNGVIRLTRPLGELKIPPTVQAILAARIDRLPSDEKDLLQTLAVIGKEFLLSLVREVARKSDDELARMLDSLQLGEFIYEQPAFPDIEYTFKHALTQEVAYNSMLTERRKLLHERAGVALESMFAEQLDDHLSELAHHYSRSDNVAKAVEYLIRAGDRAALRSAYSEAVNQFEAALGHLEKLPASSACDQQEVTIRAKFTPLLGANYGNGSREVWLNLNRAEELCLRIGETPALIPVLGGLHSANWTAGRHVEARDIASRLLSVAAQSGDNVAKGFGHTAMGVSCAWTGDYVQARDHLELGAAPAVGKQSFESLEQRFYLLCMMHLSWMMWMLGYPEQAMHRMTQTLEIADRVGRSWEKAAALQSEIALRSHFLREYSGVRAKAQALIAMSQESGFRYWRACGMVRLGRIEVAAGNADEGIRLTLEGMALINPAEDGMSYRYFRCVLADAYLAAGIAPEGLAVIEAELPLAETSGQRFNMAELFRLKGDLLLLQGQSNSSEADRCLRKSIEIAQGQQARSWELRATTSLARLLDKRGHRDEARTMLADIYNWFTEGFDTADLKDAKALLDELGA